MMQENAQGFLKLARFKKCAAFIFFMLLFLAKSHAGEFTLGGTQTFRLNSEITGIKHELVVSLPESYEKNKEQNYPVVYFLDAYWDMPLLYSIVGNLRFDNVIPEVILVGFSVPKNQDINLYRDKYFSPTPSADKPKETGKAGDLYTMITVEAIPFIERQFRAIKSPEYRVMAGQSMGGLFSLYAMYQQPQKFKRIIAVNPAAIWGNIHLNTMNDNYLKKSKLLDAKVYISHGEHEYAPFRDATIKFKAQLAKSKYEKLSLKSDTLNGMRHTGGKGEAYARGLLWVLNDLIPKQKSGLQTLMEGG